MKRWLTGLSRFLAAFLLFAFLLLLVGLVVLRTQWFGDKVRSRIVVEVEKATGGRASLGSFSFDPSTLEVTVKDFVLRGKEPEKDPPLARVEQIKAGFKVTSVWGRSGHLALLEVRKPLIRIVTFPDGTTNIPGPKVARQGKSVFEHFVSLAARRFDLSDGWFEYDHQRAPLNLKAENLAVNFAWDAVRQRYQGTVAANPFHFNWPKIAPLAFQTEVQLSMGKEGLVFDKAVATSGRSRITAAGSLLDYRTPKIDLDVQGDFQMAEYVKPLKLPLSPEGVAHFKGKFSYHDRLLLTGTLTGKDLAVRQPAYEVPGIDATAAVRLDSSSVHVTDIQGTVFGGRFEGEAFVKDWRDFSAKGSLAGLSLDQLRRLERTARPIAWSAMLSGPIELSGIFTPDGVRNFRTQASLDVKSTSGKIPVDGVVHASYEQEGGNLRFRPSLLQTPHTRAEFSGDLRDRIRVRVDTEDLNDFLPAMALFSSDPPDSLPVRLESGSARFDGSVISPVGDGLSLQGAVTALNVAYGKWKLERISTAVEVNASGVSASNLQAQLEDAVVAGDLQLALANWRANESSAIRGSLNLVRAPLDQLLRLAGRQEPVQANASGSFRISGLVGDPSISGSVRLTQGKISNEPFDAVTFDLAVAKQQIQATNGLVKKGRATHSFDVTFRHPDNSFASGRIDFRVKAANQSLADIEMIQRARKGVTGDASVEASGALDVSAGRMVVDHIDAKVNVRAVAIEGKPLGSLDLIADSEGQRLVVSASGDLAGSPWKGGGEWQLTGDSPGLGQIDMGTFSFDRIHEVASIFRPIRPLPFDGQVTGAAVFSGSLRKPETLRAHVTLTNLRIEPRNPGQSTSASVIQELTLQNDGPIVFDYGVKGLQIAQAKLTGKDTNLQLGGALGTDGAAPWNLTLSGGLNLGLFQDYVPGLRTGGSAAVNATVRGTLNKLVLGGRAEIKDASVYHRDFSNGLDKANGLVTFDRNRALLQNLTAQTGGGEVKMNGFVTFATQDSPMAYRLNSRIERVRVRWPEGASTTADANLSLTGTVAQSLLAGNVTILRSGFNARTDIGAALLEPAKPVQTPTGNALLQGMQFDVRVNSAPNLQLETSLTSGLAASVDIRLRGSPLKPVVLGNVSVNQGEINFFGTRYNITRGTVSFFNAARVEPVLDLDLETTVRAIVVNMNVSGPVDKLNITYRSDPPLQTQDIVALLAVGRTPGTSTVAPQSNVANSSSGLYAGTNTLLGQALSAGVSSRLNRFFGVSRVKIDPQLTGLESTPQARLTIEQQISRDITLTYVTNLTGALQQLIRLQWDVSRAWSVTATRDENGVIGADLLVRKRFK